MTSSIDFLRRRREPVIGWCLLAAGVAAIAGSVGVSRHWSHERSAVEAADQERAAAMERARQLAARPKKPSLELVRLQNAMPQLHQPWLPVLRFIEEATQAPVFLLGMSVAPDTGLVKLDGEAASFDDVVAYLRRLSDDGPLKSVQLRSHEAIVDPTGRATVRFSVNATWLQK
jgi:hypothetical protein